MIKELFTEKTLKSKMMTYHFKIGVHDTQYRVFCLVDRGYSRYYQYIEKKKFTFSMLKNRKELLPKLNNFF